MKFSKFEIRAVIKYMACKGESYTSIHSEMLEVCGKSAPSLSTVHFWVKEYKRGRESTLDEKRSGRPKIAVTEHSIDRVRNAIEEDSRISIEMLSMQTNLSRGSLYDIIHVHLNMTKRAAKWTPRKLSDNDRHRRIECSKVLLSEYNRDPVDFSKSLVTGDETWLYQWEPFGKTQSMEWVERGKPAPVQCRQQSGTSKVLATIFWDIEGVVMIDYCPPNTTITGAYYAQLMSKLRNEIKTKRRGKLSRGIRLLHDNAPPHKSHIAQAAIAECGFNPLSHPPYSPDLAPSDYFLFGTLKNSLRGKIYESISELTDATNDFLAELPSKAYHSAIEALPKKWETCITSNGHYFEQ